jgi:toxin-antitoxin system PIN domain toxin
MNAGIVDVNVLIALFDSVHPHYEASHRWLRSTGGHFATCPIVQNGCVRIIGGPAHKAISATPAEAAERLRELCAGPKHEFWPEDISLLDETRFDLQQIQGPKQLTDIYLLGLAVKHDGHLVTFDRSIPWRAVKGAKASHLKILVS